MSAFLQRTYSVLVEDEEDHGCLDLPEEACREVPGNAARIVGALTLQQIGDRIVDPKTVLAWLLTGLGAPSLLIGMLVPVREAGSLLPQAAMVPGVRRFGRRSRVWAVGAVGQAIAAILIAVAAATLEGSAAGVAVVGLLALFAVARAIGSISSKDVLGKTIPKGNRGSVTGIAAAVAGLVTLGVGVALTILGENADITSLSLLIGVAAVLWLVAAGVFLRIEESPSPGDESAPVSTVTASLRLLCEDAPFRRFVIVRALLFVTALSPPYVVALTAGSAGLTLEGLGGLGLFVVASGVATMLGSPIWGRFADRSSRRVMAWAAGGGAVVVGAFLGGLAAGVDSIWLGPITYLCLAFLHTGARMGRKTYVVDLGRGDRRTSYVAVSNTVTGVLLAATGAVGALASQIGPEWALAFLATVGAAGVVAARSLPEVQPG